MHALSQSSSLYYQSSHLFIVYRQRLPLINWKINYCFVVTSLLCRLWHDELLNNSKMLSSFTEYLRGSLFSRRFSRGETPCHHLYNDHVFFKPFERFFVLLVSFNFCPAIYHQLHTYVRTSDASRLGSQQGKDESNFNGTTSMDFIN